MTFVRLNECDRGQLIQFEFARRVFHCHSQATFCCLTGLRAIRWQRQGCGLARAAVDNMRRFSLNGASMLLQVPAHQLLLQFASIRKAQPPLIKPQTPQQRTSGILALNYFSRVFYDINEVEIRDPHVVSARCPFQKKRVRRKFYKRARACESNDALPGELCVP